MLTALHPLVEGGTIPPDEWLHATTATPPPLMAISWIASYCPAPNRRDELVRRLQASLPVVRARVRVKVKVRGKVRDREPYNPITLTL